MAKANWIVGAKHQAFGIEGSRSYTGSERGARGVAGKLAREAGHGWKPFVSPALSGRMFASISSDAGGYIDIEAESLEELARELPADWRGTARAYDAPGFVRGFIGRDADGAPSWRVA